MVTLPSKESLRVYRKSEVVFEENSTGREMYIIRSGKVKLVLGAKGQEAEIGVFEPGEYFGEMALVDASPRSATAIAVEDNTELEVLGREGFLQEIREHPEFALDVMHELCERIRRGNVLYSEVIRGLMSPYCPRNCLKKTMDAFARDLMCGVDQKTTVETMGTVRWKCVACDYIYDPRIGDPSSGIKPGTSFEELPDSWVCPVCGVAKNMFQKLES